MSGRSSAARAVAQSDGGVLASWDSVNKELYSVLCTPYYVLCDGGLLCISIFAGVSFLMIIYLYSLPGEQGHWHWHWHWHSLHTTSSRLEHISVH